VCVCVFVCVCVCVCVCDRECVYVCVTEVIKCDDNSLQLQWLGRRGQTKK